jgi:CHAD domain-containing protein
MQSPRYLALLDALVAAADAPQFTEAATAPVSEALPPLVRSAWKRLARDVRELRRKSPDEPWHAARIRAKHARYAADALVPVFGKPAKRLSKQLEQVTELLGRHQDAAIAAETAQSLASAKDVGGKAGYALGLLHDQQRAEVGEMRRQFVEVWPSVSAPEWRHWLKQTV